MKQFKHSKILQFPIMGSIAGGNCPSTNLKYNERKKIRTNLSKYLTLPQLLFTFKPVPLGLKTLESLLK